MEAVPYKNKIYPNKAENAFQEYAAVQGWTITKRGWPDFIVHGADGNFLFFVEVKKNKNQRRALEGVNQSDPRKRKKAKHAQHQARVHALLNGAGLYCKVWTPKDAFGKD